ncbi:MAG TPA: hypothetical protein VMA98_02700 [Candidatus Acidoferrales bacterium]|nr:hypothetical protein [Candidatus Acidoferrales bacterium]
MIRVFGAVLALSALVLAGCGGGGGSRSLLPAPSATSLASPAKTSATFKIVIPSKTPANASRRPHYVTANVTGISFSVTQANSPANGLVYYPLNEGESYCTSGGSGLTCTVQVQAPPGTDTFVVDLYDYAVNENEPYEGYIVATGTVTQAITAQSANTINITTDGVPTFAVMGMTNAYPTASGSYPLSIDIIDPDGNTIVGSFDAPLTLTSTNSNVTFSNATLNQNSDATGITVNWNGTALGSAATLSLNSTDTVLPNETGTSVMATQSFYPNGRGITLSQPYFVFAQAGDLANFTATGVNGATLDPGSIDQYPPLTGLAYQCGDYYAAISGSAGSYTITSSATTISTGQGDNVGTCYVGIIDDQDDEFFVPVIVGPTPEAEP